MTVISGRLWFPRVLRVTGQGEISDILKWHRTVVIRQVISSPDYVVIRLPFVGGLIRNVNRLMDHGRSDQEQPDQQRYDRLPIRKRCHGIPNEFKHVSHLPIPSLPPLHIRCWPSFNWKSYCLHDPIKRFISGMRILGVCPYWGRKP